MRFDPQAFAALSREPLDRGVARALERRLLALVLFVMPRQSGLYLLEADVERIRAAAFALGREDAADDAAVTIALVPRDADRLVEDERCELKLGAIGERLAPLGRVDTEETDAVPNARCVEYGEGVSVGDTDDFAVELGCARRGREQKNECCSADGVARYDGSSPGQRLCRAPSKGTSPASVVAHAQA